MLRKSVLFLITLPLAALAATVITAGPAAADGGVCNPGCAAHVEFQSYGEIFTVHDYADDGIGTVGEIEWVDPASGVIFGSVVMNHNGYYGSPRVQNLDIPEGTRVKYRACLDARPGADPKCSGWYRDVA